MAYVVADRIKETTTVTGTGAATLLGAASGFRAFSSVCANADTVPYCIQGQTPGEWEIGIGTWGTGGILTRTTVLKSSNAGAAVNFSAGTKDVFLTIHADRLVDIAGDNTIPINVPVVQAQDSQTPITLTRFYYNAVALADTYIQFSLQNKSTGASASTDFIVTADNGSDTTNYGDFGINGSGYSSATWTITGAGDVYCYSQSSHLSIGTATAGKDVIFHVGGTMAANEVGRWQADGLLMPAGSTDPGAQAANKIKIYGKMVAGRGCLKYVGPAGIDSMVQAHIGQDKVGMWLTAGQVVGATPVGWGIATPTMVGTATARAWASTSLFTRMRRIGYVSANTAGSMVAIYSTAGQWSVGNGSGQGGFFMVMRFGRNDTTLVGVSRFFFGMSSTVAAPTNVDPTTMTNTIGLAIAASGSNLLLVYGGSAAQTPIDLGANFPAQTVGTDMYELILFASPGKNNEVGYKVTRLNTGHVAEGILTAATPGTQLPANTTALAPRMWGTNNSTTGYPGFDFASMYISSDY